MKPFNLEEALKGAPVKLRNGCKAYVLVNVKDLFPSTDTDYPLIGVHAFSYDNNEFDADERWESTGKSIGHRYGDNSYDIVSMWEEIE